MANPATLPAPKLATLAEILPVVLIPTAPPDVTCVILPTNVWNAPVAAPTVPTVKLPANNVLPPTDILPLELIDPASIQAPVASTLPFIVKLPNVAFTANMLPPMLKYSVPAPDTSTLPMMVCSAPGVARLPIRVLPNTLRPVAKTFPEEFIKLVLTVPVCVGRYVAT
jgi:hypothetical protein